MNKKWIADFLKLLGIGLAYYFTARRGLELDAVSGFATLLWPPTGIALASLILYGIRFWPAVFAAAFLVNAHFGASIGIALGIATGNSLEAIVGVWLLLNVINFRPSLDRLRDVACLLVFGCMIGAAVSATIGVFSLWAGHVAHFEGFAPTWKAWWTGDALGALIVTPTILMFHGLAFRRVSLRLVVEGLILLSLLAMTAAGLFLQISPKLDAVSPTLPYILFPFLVWAALRFRQVGAISVMFFVSATAAYGTIAGFGPFAHGAIHDNLALLNSFLGIYALTALTLGGAVAERRLAILSRAQMSQELRQSHLAVHASMQELQTIADTVPAFITRISTDQTFSFVNRAYAEWLKLNSSEIVGRKVKDVLGPEIYKKIEPHVERVLTGESARYDLSWKNKVGEERIVQLDYTPEFQAGGKINGYVVVGHDVTELRKAIAARDEFLSIASHELKTPLTSLYLQVQMARQRMKNDQINPELREKMERTFEISGRQVNRLTDLIDDLLDASRIQTGKLNFNFERTNLSALIEDMVGRMAEQLNKAKCPLEMRVSQNIAGRFDPVRMEQVVDNFLSNAIKYAPGAPIEISLDRKEDHAVRMIVSDHGPGIPIDQQQKIFERFERGSFAKTTGGLGLGLFIVKEIVNGHHGTVSLESAPGHGCRFIVDLPLDESV